MLPRVKVAPRVPRHRKAPVLLSRLPCTHLASTFAIRSLPSFACVLFCHRLRSFDVPRQALGQRGVEARVSQRVARLRAGGTAWLRLARALCRLQASAQSLVPRDCSRSAVPWMTESIPSRPRPPKRITSRVQLPPRVAGLPRVTAQRDVAALDPSSVPSYLPVREVAGSAVPIPSVTHARERLLCNPSERRSP